MLSNHLLHAIPILVAPMLNAKHETEPSIVSALLIMSAIRTALVDLNAF